MRYFYDHKLQIELKENQVLDSQFTLRGVIDDLYPDRWINNTQEHLPDGVVRFFIEADISLHGILLARGFKEADNGANT
jgi:hypothetical protein